MTKKVFFLACLLLPTLCFANKIDCSGVTVCKCYHGLPDGSLFLSAGNQSECTSGKAKKYCNWSPTNQKNTPYCYLKNNNAQYSMIDCVKYCAENS